MGDEGEKTHRLSGADQKLKWRKYGTQLEKAIQKLQVKWLWTLSRNWNLHDWRTTLYKLKLKRLQFTNTWLTVWFSVCYVIQKSLITSVCCVNINSITTLLLRLLCLLGRNCRPKSVVVTRFGNCRSMSCMPDIQHEIVDDISVVVYTTVL